MLVFGFIWLFGFISSFIINKRLQVVLNGKSSQVPQDSFLGPTLFLLYINELPDVICDIVIYADNTLLSIPSVIRHLICGNNLNWLLNFNLIYETPWTGARMLQLTFSWKFDCGSCIISIAKSTSKKIGALICFMKLLSPEVALYLYKSTIHPFMEYCCPIWAGAPSSSLELLEKLQVKSTLFLT